MRRGLKIILGLGITATIVLAALLVIGIFMIRKSFPTTTGVIRVGSLGADVEVFRDAFGVPHIFAQTDHDLYFAVGYVHAQDRLWQMELVRRAGMGRLAEVLGPEALEIDRMFRVLGLRRVAQHSEALLDEKTRAALQAYADGVSEFIATHEGRYPVEFDILGFNPEPWTVEHSLLVSRLMAWELNYARWIDILRGIVTEKMGAARAQELYPEWSEDSPLIVPPELAKRKITAGGQELLGRDRAFRSLFGLGGFQTGSNAWALSGSMTTTGRPILANDTHLFLTAPGRFYELHTVTPEMNVVGMSIAGVPFVIIGRNRAISWGVTNAMLDDADYYVEEVDSADHPSLVRSLGRWVPVETYRDTIHVKGERSVVLTSYWTPDGPIINRIEPSASLSKELLSFRWTGHEPSADARAFYLINRASTWREFTRALSYFSVPAQNFVYADTAGTIGYQLAGKVPIRGTSGSAVPMPGWAQGYEWKGFVRPEELPSVVNAPEGFVATANNKIASRTYPYHLSTYWEPDWRIRRIREMLGEGGAFSVEDMRAMQRDVASVHARDLVPIILASYDGVDVSDRTLRDALTYFRNWTFEMNDRDVATSIFHAFITAAIRNTFSDELGPEAFRLFDSLATPPLLALTNAMHDSLSPWFDRIDTREVETRAEIVRMSLEEGLRFLKAERGDDIKAWTWGSFHQAEFAHLFASSPVLRPIFCPGPFPTGGSHSTVNNGYYRVDEPFANVVGPSMRMIVDLADSTGYESALPPGQSGHVFHKQYDDQVTLWLNAGTKHTLMLEKDVRRAGYDRLTLRPRQ
jgi:penicillin G amidase